MSDLHQCLPALVHLFTLFAHYSEQREQLFLCVCFVHSVACRFIASVVLLKRHQKVTLITLSRAELHPILLNAVVL